MEIDIRPTTDRPKGLVRTTKSLLRYQKDTGWVAFRVGSRNGWYVFNRIRRNKLRKSWVIGYSMTFGKAVSKARQEHGVAIPTSPKWTDIYVKHYNLTNITEAETLLKIINQLN